jgi:hypothetical protein
MTLRVRSAVNVPVSADCVWESVEPWLVDVEIIR